MYELIQVAENTFYIDCPAKIGLYRENENDVWLIDSGNDKDAGKKVLKQLEQRQWRLKALLLTHSNADHMGGARFLEERTGCSVYASEIECGFIRSPILEPSFLYGGFPCKTLRNKFLLAPACTAEPFSEAILPPGMEILELPGHFFGMAGFRTPDDVWFLADCMAGDAVLEKYHIFFIYDVEQYLKTLDAVERLSGKCFIPSHAPVLEDIVPLARRNREKVRELFGLLADLCREPLIFEEILKRVFDHYALKMDFNQYVLVGSTIRSCLSYLCDSGVLAAGFAGNRLLWRAGQPEV